MTAILHYDIMHTLLRSWPSVVKDKVMGVAHRVNGKITVNVIITGYGKVGKIGIFTKRTFKS